MSQPQENEPIPMARSLAPVSHGGLGLRQDMQGRAAALRKQSAMYSNSFVDLQTLAVGMAEARLLPQGVSPQAAAIIMLKAGELGIPPVSAFEFLYVIGNKVSLQGQMVMALVQRSGLGTIQVSERSATAATAVGKRPGYEPLKVRFTLEEAKTLGVRNLDKFPADMLVWKAVARVGRLLFADLLGGMDVADAGGNVIDSVADEGDYQVDSNASNKGQYGGSDSLPSDEEAEPEPIEGEFSHAPPPEDPWWKADLTEEAKNTGWGCIWHFLAVKSESTREERAEAIEAWFREHPNATPADLVKQAADASANQPAQPLL